MSDRSPRLTPTQAAVLLAASDGVPLAAVAARLGLQRSEVASWLSGAYRALDVAHLPLREKRGAAVRVARAAGLLVGEALDARLPVHPIRRVRQLPTLRERAAAAEAALEAVSAERNAFAAAVAAVSVKAHEWAELAPSDDWGLTPRDTTLADAGRYLISLMATSAALPPAAAPVAPEPRPSAAGASGGDAPGFVGHGSRPGRARDSRPDPSGPEEALSGPSRRPAAPDGPVPASSPGTPATAASQRIDPTTR